jgi:chromate transporter
VGNNSQMDNRKWLLYFFRLGATGFGGPLALIAQMREDLVIKNKIIDEFEFNQSLALIKTMPGPVAVQMIAFLSYRRKGLWQAVVSSILFIFPAFIMMLLLAIFYKEFRSFKISSSALDGMQAGALALISAALLQLLKDYIKNKMFWYYLFLSFIFIIFLHLSEVLVIFIMAAVAVSVPRFSSKLLQIKSIPILELILICLKAGGLAFGTGIAIIPMMQKDFVERLGWLTQQQFLDALAFGQLTPGPISVTVTFVGYVVAGFWGAVIATIAIFLPGIFNMTTWFPRVYDWFLSQKWVKDFILGAISVIAAGIVVSIYQMGHVLNYKSISISLIIFGLSRMKKIKSWMLIGMSAVFGLILL